MSMERRMKEKKKKKMDKCMIVRGRGKKEREKRKNIGREFRQRVESKHSIIFTKEFTAQSVYP